MWLLPLIWYSVALAISITGIRYQIDIFKFPVYFSVPLILAVFIPLSIIYLLPLDYVSHNFKDSLNLLRLPDNVILYIWKSNYWITFILTWLVLPLLQEFYKSGHRSSMLKVKDAFKQNLKFQFIILGVSALGMIYLMLEVGLSLGHVKLMIIALSHIYSLVLALWLMAHGLISIPRNLWRKGSLVLNLNSYYLQVPRIVDILEDTKITFKEDVLEISVLKKSFTSNSAEDFSFRDWILTLYEKIPEDIKASVENLLMEDELNSISRETLTLPRMTKLTSRFNQNLYKYQAYQSAYDSLISKIISLEDVVNSDYSDNYGQREANYRFNPNRSRLLPQMRYYLEHHIKPILNRVAAVLLSVLSFVILESEFFHSTGISVINIIVYSDRFVPHDFGKLLVCCLVFLYMLFASLNSLTHLKVFGMYHLVPRHSDPISACFYTTYVARLTIPLSYNFITLFISRESIFEKWFGESIHLTGLFNLMNNWLPRFVLLPVFLTLFHVYDKLKKKIGLGGSFYDSWANFDDSDSDNERNRANSIGLRKELLIAEAKRIVNRESLKWRQGSENDSRLRAFNLAQQPQNHRAVPEYDEADLGQRIDLELLHSDDDFIGRPQKSSFWDKVKSSFRLARTGVFPARNSSYRDSEEVHIDEFNYDDDANENIIV